MRRIFLGFLLASGLAGSFFGLAGLVSAGENRGVKLPEKSGESCGVVIDAVEKDLAQRGYFIEWKTPEGRTIYPQTEVNAEEIPKYYYDYPENRTETVTFFLAGDSTRLYQGFLSSPVLMATMGAQVMAACESVGKVDFSHWYEGYVPVGYFPDGMVRAFQWEDVSDFDSPNQRQIQTSEGLQIKYKWGYYFSP